MIHPVIQYQLESTQLVGWLEFNIPFQHKYGYIRHERSGVKSYPLTQWRKASDILTKNLAAFFVQQPPKKEKGSRDSFKLLC